MEIFEYGEGKSKSKGLSVISLLEDMQDLETFFGNSESKIYDHWYSIKRSLQESLAKPQDAATKE